MRPPPLDRGVCLIRKASGEQLIKDQPQRVDIAANAGLALSNLLWSHVGRRTRSFAPTGGIVVAEGQSEVGDAHPPSSIEHDVGGLQITMQQSAIMRGGQAGADLVRGLQSLVRGQAADAAQQRREVLAVDVLHGEKVLAVHLADVVNPTDIRMRNLAGVPHLRMKPGESRGIVLERGGKKLQGHNIPELEIFGAVDFAHAAAPQQSHDPVSLDENRARRESAASWRVRTWGSWRGRGSSVYPAPGSACREWQWHARMRNKSGRSRKIRPRSQSR